MYDYIVGNSNEFASRDGLSPGARRHYDYLVGGSSTPTSTAPRLVPSSAVPIGGISERATAIPSPTSAPASKDDLSPEARRIYDYLVGNTAAPPTTDVSTNLLVRTELDAVHDAVDIDNTDLNTTMPTICLSECPSHGASLEVALSLSATATPSTTIGSVTERCCFDPEPAGAIWTPTSALDQLEGGASTSSLTGYPTAFIVAPTVVDTKATDLDAVVPNNCSSECPSHDDVVSVSVLNSYATQTSCTTTGDIVRELATHELSDQTIRSSRCIDTPPSLLAETYKVFNVVTIGTAIVPWPPPSYVRSQEGNMCTDMLQALLLDGFVLRSMQLMLWAGKYRWPPPTPNRSTTCRSSNLHLRMDTKHTSGDRPFSTTMELEQNATLTVSTFTLGAQRAQLQPTLFKWSDIVCHDTRSLTPNTRVDMRIDLLLARRATCTLWTWYYLHNLHCSPGIIPDWELLILSLGTWLLVNCDFASVNFQWSITVQHSTSSSGFFAILNREAEIQRHYSCARVLTDNVRKWIYRPILRILMEACSPFVVPDRGYNWQKLDSTTENTAMILLFLHILRGNTHPSEVKPPWPPSLRMWLNLPMGNIPSSPGRIVVISLCIVSVLRYLNRGNPIIEPKPPWPLLVTNSGNLLTWFLHVKIPTAAVCKSEFRFYTPGYILFLCCALVQLKISWTIILVSLRSCFQCCPAQCEFIYSCENFQWTIAWSLSCSFSLSISWSFNYPPWGDWLLACSTRRVFLSSCGKCQLKIAGSLDLALAEWNPWSSGVYFWSSYLGASACGLDAPILLWLQFALQNSLASQEASHFTVKIGRLHDILIELGIYTRSIHYVEYFEWQIPWYNGDREFLDAFPLSAHPPSKALQLPWDPGDCFASAWSQDNFGRVDDGSSFLLDTSQVPWDPGGLSEDRLGGKPNFKEGGCQQPRTLPLGWTSGPSLLGLACT